jgi:hypothetical protein
MQACLNKEDQLLADPLMVKSIYETNPAFWKNMHAYSVKIGA